MSLARMEQAPAVRPEYLRREAYILSADARILTLGGIIAFLWLVTFGFLVIATTWALINLRDIKTRKAPGIDLKDL